MRKGKSDGNGKGRTVVTLLHKGQQEGGGGRIRQVRRYCFMTFHRIFVVFK